MDLLSLLNENARLTNAQLAVMLGKNRRRSGKRNCRLPTKGYYQRI